MSVENKIVVFGAGKIGRSFIGQLFSIAGFEVVFVDVFKPVIDEMNRRRNYNVVVKGDKEVVLNIKNIRGIYADDETSVVNEIVNARILAVSVGQNGLSLVIPLIAKGLSERYATDKTSALDVIIAENMRNASDYFQNELKRYLPDNYPIDQLVGLVETSIGKMVPIMLKKDIQEDILQVFAESYNTLILDKKAFKNPIPDVKGLAPKENMKAWVDRKLFIHNLAHVATAYIGYIHNPKFKYLYEVLELPYLQNMVRSTVLQAAHILVGKYPNEFTFQDLTEHIDDLLIRFQNKALGDTIFRVGCDLQRKLGPEDRLVGAIRLAGQLDLPYDKVLTILVYGIHFRQVDESGNIFPGDKEFSEIYDQGIQHVLTQVCGFDVIKDQRIISEAKIVEQSITSNHTFQLLTESQTRIKFFEAN